MKIYSPEKGWHEVITEGDDKWDAVGDDEWATVGNQQFRSFDDSSLWDVLPALSDGMETTEDTLDDIRKYIDKLDNLFTSEEDKNQIKKLVKYVEWAYLNEDGDDGPLVDALRAIRTVYHRLDLDF